MHITDTQTGTIDEPLLFHTGPRRLFAATRDAVRHVLPPGGDAGALLRRLRDALAA